MRNLNLLPAFVDLEMTNLSANFGRILCGCIKPYGQPVQTFRIDETTAGKKEPWNDGELAVALRDAIQGQFMIVSYNGIMFDVKYLNSRLMKHGQEVLRKPLHKDLLFTAKFAFALSDNRLITVQEFLGLDTKKTRLDPEQWNMAAAGSSAALDYVVEHCVADVGVLEEVFEYLIPFVKEIHTGG